MGEVTLKTRRHDLDWLRVAAVLLLVPFHSCLIFVLNPDSIMYIKDTVNSQILDRVAGFIAEFHMEILFVIAGASTYFSLQSRSGRQYLGERSARLFVPALFGIIVLIPPMTYLTRISSGASVSFGAHFLGFFQVDPMDLAGYQGTFTPAHLWFILFLYVFSIAGLPIFLGLSNGRCHNSLAALGRFFKAPLSLYLLSVPIGLVSSFDVLGGKNPLVYFMYFFFGFLLMTGDGYQRAIDRHAYVSLVLAVGLESLRLMHNLQYLDWSVPEVAGNLVGALTRWAWVLALMGLGHRYLNFRNSALDYLSEAAFPFYILHLPLNTVVGYFVIRLTAGVAVKYGVIVVLTTAVVFSVYELSKRAEILRLFLGMRSSKGREKAISIRS